MNTRRRVLLVSWVLGLAAVATEPARAALTFYSERLEFDSENPGLAIEGFEEGVVDTNFTSPLDSNTSNAVFSPGDIEPGISITTDLTPSFDLRVRQLGTTKAISTPASNRKLVIDFAPGVSAVGLDVYQLNAPGDVTIQVFGAGGLLGQTAVATDDAGAFFGVASDADAITQIVLDDSDILPAADDIAFGDPDEPVLSFFSKRLDFDSAFPGLPIEGFEEGVVDTNFTSPLDSTTSNAVFSPGDIEPGISITTDLTPSFDLRVRQLGTTKAISTPATNRKLVIEFDPGATATGFDVYQLLTAGDVRIEVFGASGPLGETLLPTEEQGTFVGIESLGEPITRIELDDTDIVPAADDIAFQLPEPGPAVSGLVALSALALMIRCRVGKAPDREGR